MTLFVLLMFWTTHKIDRKKIQQIFLIFNTTAKYMYIYVIENSQQARTSKEQVITRSINREKRVLLYKSYLLNIEYSNKI